ncbi:MAG: SDR family oxidoreductase [Salinimicrobium sp.]
MNTDGSTKLAIVTGGSSGIGHAIAKKLRQQEITVVVADKAEPSGLEKDLIFRKCDVTSSEDINSLYAWVHDNYGTPDYLVLNAGQGIQEKLTEGDPEKWQKVMNTNLMGPLRFIRSFTPDMLQRKSGNVIFISSVSANQPHPYGGIYAASKTALEVIAETLRLETLPHLNVTVVSPGIVKTNFFEHQISGNNDIEEMGMGHLSAEEIADDVLYAINKKKGSSINKIVTRPTLQTF